MGLVLLGVAWLVPNHYLPWTTFHAELLVFSGMWLLLASRVVAAGHPGLRVPWPVIPWVLAVAAVPWVQFALGIVAYLGDALTSMLYLGGLAAAIIVGYNHNLAKTAAHGGVDGVLHTVWVAALLSGCIGLLQWLSLEKVLDIFVTDSDLGARVMGNLAQSNHVATLLVLGMVALACLFDRRIVGGFAFTLAVAFLSGVLVLTQSRTGLLGALVTGMFLLCKRRHWDARWPAPAMVLWAVGLFAAVRWLPELSQALLIGGDRGVSLADSSGRFQMWRQLSEGILQRPWLGYGWNQSAAAQMAGAIAYPGDLQTNYAHNLFLDLAVWNGIPLALLFTAAGAIWALRCLWSVRGTTPVYAMAFMLPILIHSMLEYPFAYAYFLLPLGFMVGVVEAHLRGADRLVPARSLWAALAFVAFVGVLFTREYFLVEEDFRVTRFENMRIGRTPDTYEIPSIRLITHMGEMLESTRYRARPGMSAHEMALMDRVNQRFSMAALKYRYALALGLNGHPDEAARLLWLMRCLYGPVYYQTAVYELREEQRRRYPQLSAVKTP